MGGNISKKNNNNDVDAYNDTDEYESNDNNYNIILKKIYNMSIKKDIDKEIIHMQYTLCMIFAYNKMLNDDDQGRTLCKMTYFLSYLINVTIYDNINEKLKCYFFCEKIIQDYIDIAKNKIIKKIEKTNDIYLPIIFRLQTLLIYLHTSIDKNIYEKFNLLYYYNLLFKNDNKNNKNDFNQQLGEQYIENYIFNNIIILYNNKNNSYFLNNYNILNNNYLKNKIFSFNNDVIVNNYDNFIKTFAAYTSLFDMKKF